MSSRRLDRGPMCRSVRRAASQYPTTPRHSAGFKRRPSPVSQQSAMQPVANTVVRQAVAAFAAAPSQTAAFDVLRSCRYGDLLFDTTGSDVPGHDGYAAGATLQIRRGTGPDGKGALLAFTRNEEIARLYPPETSTMSLVQPATGVLDLARHPQDAWLYIDPAGPTCALSAVEIDFALRNPNNEPLKAAIANLADARTNRQAVLSLLKQEGPLLLAVDETSVPGKAGLRTTRMADGSAGLLAFTSAPEVVSHNPADAVMASTTRRGRRTGSRGWLRRSRCQSIGSVLRGHNGGTQSLTTAGASALARL